MTFGLRLFMIVVQLQLCLAFVTSNLRETSSISSASGTAPIMLAKMHSSDVGMLDGLGIQEQSRGIPKVETGVISLLEKYPGADGRGVKIAILDTGCDLAAAGLTTTSDGKPKYLDFIDCTGDGNVDMNKTVEIDDDSCHVVGLSGRNLTLGDWATNVKELRLGAVRLFHLLPGSVERRLGTERKEEFMVKHQHLIAETQLSLDTLRDRVIGTDKNSTSKKEVKELELMLEQLQDIAESYEDSGPLMDVVMFNDGESWRAVVDLEANGDLSESIPMAPFGYERQIGTLAFGSAVTFCVQVYEDGKVLSIVTDAGSHGTHVAGIATANFAGVDEEGGKANNKAHLNGVAPGAQVLACKIGDGRLGSAETGTGLVRALIAAKKYGCDLINLSYGEPSWQPDSGRVSQTFSDAVYKWGMTVFTSAGNDGPALSSLGSPGALSAPITVGAYVSPDMMVDQYSTLPPEEQAPLEGASYYFSSRGPTPDGMLPDICAPGGAIAPIPRHALQGKAQYHGTSMSSPNACGVAACILSALKQEGIEKCGPVELKRGIINSAIAVDIVEPFSQGAGLISAVRAVDYITSHHGKHGQSLAIDVSIPSRNKARGIYIRDELELEGPMTFGVLVQPRFDHAMKRTPQEIDELLSLELNLELKPSESWVSCPDRMTLLSAKERNGQTFSVRLQTNDLPPGAHFAKVDAIDPLDPGRGAIFQIPITVIIPHSRFVDIDSPSFILNDDERVVLMPNGIDLSTTYKLTQGEPTRRFITVPPTAEWATIKLRSASSNQLDTSPHHVLMHAIPFVRGDLPNTMIQLKKAFQVKEGVEEVYHVRVKGGASLEVCLQLMWLANPSPTSVEADIEFHSLNIRAPTLASSQPVVIAAASEFARLGASAPLRSEKLNPTASLKYVERTLRPENYDIKSGSVELDILPPSDAEIQATKDNQSGEDMSPDGKQIYDMRLRYQFKIEGDEAIAVTPVIPSLFHQIYDSPVDSQLWVLEDSNSQILGYGSSMHMSKQVSLKKGDYTVTLLIRHPNRNLLEQMKAIPCQISLGLSSELACNVYSQLDKASTPAVTNDGRSPLEAMYLRKGTSIDVTHMHFVFSIYLILARSNYAIYRISSRYLRVETY